MGYRLVVAVGMCVCVLSGCGTDTAPKAPAPEVEPENVRQVVRCLDADLKACDAPKGIECRPNEYSLCSADNAKGAVTLCAAYWIGLWLPEDPPSVTKAIRDCRDTHDDGHLCEDGQIELYPDHTCRTVGR